MSQTILITGGAGFIGSHLCRVLVKNGHRVRVLDLKDPPTPVETVEYKRGDIRNSEDLQSAISGVDAVYHFAAIVSVPVCQNQPLESYSTNLTGTLQVMEAVRQEMKKSGKKTRVIFAGSSVVYGHLGQKGLKLPESQTADFPLSFYGAQKLGSEQTIRLYSSLHQIPAVIFRFFNVYGPGQDPSSPYSGVISIFSKCLQEGAPLSLHGGGKQTRDFVYVGEVARACSMALDLEEKLCDGRAINLGTGSAITVRELAQIMVKLSGKEVSLRETPPREGDVLYSQSDPSRAQSLLNWSSSVSFEEGLRSVLA